MKILLIILFFTACTKETMTEAPLSFRMNQNKISPKIESAEGTRGCPGYRDYQITASEGEKFFKINVSTIDTLREGLTTATFWYQNEGRTYSLYDMAFNVTSYKNGILQASFAGGIVNEGRINLKIAEE